MLRHHRSSLIFTAICLVIAAVSGATTTGTLMGTLGVLWIVVVLSVLEISLSFDNAIVDATILRGMAPIWRRRFLVWGILIAVFGMRIIFPLLIVAAAAQVGPIAAMHLAMVDPVTYERILTAAHVSIAGFGGAFLAMVGLTFFMDEEKEVHWIGPIERPTAALSRLSGLAIGLVLLVLLAIARTLQAEEAVQLLAAGVLGIVVYIAVEAIGDLLGGEEIEAAKQAGASGAGAVGRAGLGAFLYLEMLDASFSLDGVIGAFALSNNLLVIALGLGIGAMFVRSTTLMLVDHGTLTTYRYLEHGAFYAILALAAIMLLSVRYEIPDAVTGLIGAGVIAAAFWASVRSNRRDAAMLAGTGERLT